MASAIRRSRPSGSGLRDGRSPPPYTRKNRGPAPSASRMRRLMSPGLVGEHGERMRGEAIEGLLHAGVEARVLGEPPRVLLEEDGQRVLGGQGDARVHEAARDQVPRPAADERADDVQRRGSGAEGSIRAQRGVHGVGEVAAGIDERAVEVEDDERAGRRHSGRTRSRGRRVGACSSRRPARISRISPTSFCRSSREGGDVEPAEARQELLQPAQRDGEHLLRVREVAVAQLQQRLRHVLEHGVELPLRGGAGARGHGRRGRPGTRRSARR